MKSIFQSIGSPVLILLLSGCGGGEKPMAESEVRLASVEVLEVEPSQGYPIRERFVGMVEARRSSDLAFELAGTIDEVSVDEGESVSAGAVLARIDTSRLEARRDELAAALKQANATKELSRKVLERLEKLVERGGVSVQELDEAIERVVAAAAGVSQIEAQLKSVEVDLGKSVLRAPYDGTVARRFVDEGTVVSPNALVIEWLEAGELEVRVGMASEAVGQLKRGGKVEVISNAGETIDLEVLRILPQRDRQSRTVDVILALPENKGSLRDGDLVSAMRTETIDSEGFFLPRDSLTESVRGLWACYVATPDLEAGAEAHRLDRRDLEVLHEYSDQVYVRGAIREGDWVLSSGLQKVAPGQRVKIIKVNKTTSMIEGSEEITALD
ncbi:MAG: efflux RND transporter periplasmic adaptor subunit [Verrucomicrobiales bacterium]|nr:efflux RND transporter periplasmic adaptor subunit [Verrucomicrobiales bacterium]